jgi:hypothetical protein
MFLMLEILWNYSGYKKAAIFFVMWTRSSPFRIR